MRWFGDSWGASCCEPATHTDTPVGQACDECGELIRDGDQGLLIPFASQPVVQLPFHLRCFLRDVLGEHRDSR